MPGAVRASAGLNTTEDDVARLVAAVGRIASGENARTSYVQDPRTGDFSPEGDSVAFFAQARSAGSSCSPG